MNVYIKNFIDTLIMFSLLFDILRSIFFISPIIMMDLTIQGMNIVERKKNYACNHIVNGYICL